MTTRLATQLKVCSSGTDTSEAAKGFPLIGLKGHAIRGIEMNSGEAIENRTATLMLGPGKVFAKWL